MRRVRFLMVTSALALSGAAIWASGCATFGEVCFSGDECPVGFGGGSSSSTGTTTTASGTVASSSTGLDPGCEGDIVEGLSGADNKGLISDMCGIFVQADAKGATEDGTQAAPYKSLQSAIDKAGNSKRVYACSNATTPFAEAVTVSAAVEVYGGFTCTDGWVFKAATRSLITGAANKVSLTLTESSAGAKIEGFKITSVSATDKGASSVAVAVADIAAALTECDIEAGDGADGVDGVAPTGVATAGADAPVTDPLVISACINPAALTVGASGMTTCSDGTTAGGAGGKGGITGTNSGNGQPGANGTPAVGTTGMGGAGQDATNVCVAGTAGKDGDPGSSGAAGTSPGTLSLSGFTNAAASDGTDGKPGGKGQGGGGGGGVKSSSFCPGGADGNGASGGGGGAGGCGGAGGRAGKAGGSSIAIVSLGTKLELTKVTLKSGKGGNGGKGTAGQGGGAASAGGKGGAASGVAGSKAGCNGGNGGAGGDGGPGGGGRGGHSLGLAALVTPTAITLPFTPGMAGTGGLAGTGGSPTADGSAGLGGSATAACWDFMTNKTCAK
jgi:hypothetical protein